MSHAGSGALLPFLAAHFPGTQWVPPPSSVAAPALGAAPHTRRFLFC